MNRREALKAGAAILTAAGVDGEIATVSPRNPQAFVITIPGRVSGDCRRHLHDEWKGIFKGTAIENIPLIVLHDGMQLSVVDAVETDA